jgi:sec-independent protein translocase protein TatA
MIPKVGPTELILVLLIVLIIFGVGKLPEIGGALGKAIRDFRKSSKDEEAEAEAKKAVVEQSEEKKA